MTAFYNETAPFLAAEFVGAFLDAESFAKPARRAAGD
jgi:hypothetical protein